MNAASPLSNPVSVSAENSLILAAFSPSTRRQLELTVNALSRAVRKSIRAAEALERSGQATPEEISAAWFRVTDRSATLIEFVRSLMVEPAPASTPASTQQNEPLPAPEIDADYEADAPISETAPLDVDEQLILWANEELKKLNALPEHSRQTRRLKERAAHKLILKIRSRSPALADHIQKIALAAA